MGSHSFQEIEHGNVLSQKLAGAEADTRFLIVLKRKKNISTFFQNPLRFPNNRCIIILYMHILAEEALRR